MRLESAGKYAANDVDDPILLENKGLSRAGTPSFLAPELVSEHAGPRPSVTKAVDIWALGVTLYCLLFGILPWRPDPDIPVQAKQYNVWRKIAEEDWEALDTMGADLMPTGGRHPPADLTDTGAGIIRLLDHFLQKDPAKRITLEQAKVRRALFPLLCAFSPPCAFSPSMRAFCDRLRADAAFFV